MNAFKHIKQVYFLGIGGIGMSALARYFLHEGFAVSGYDRTATDLTHQLEQEGMAIHYHDRPEGLKNLAKENTLIVRTPAVPADMHELQYLVENGFNIKKRAEVLGMICSTGKLAAVAGTHGKTSVSAMLAHIMYSSATGCTAFLGGISKNYQNNLLLSSQSDWIVSEADEFDRSFMQLQPNLAVITSMDADHLDIYGTPDAVRDSFAAFAGQVKPGGKLLLKQGISFDKAKNGVQLFRYSIGAPADFYAEKIRLIDEAYHFDLVCPEGTIENIQLNYPGLINVENMTAAAALALMAGVSPGEIRKAAASYQGVKRRFDIQYRSENYILIDDYAHHPEEIRATVASVKAMFAGRKVTGIFQPHLYSRTADFASGFAQSLDALDEIILLDIYPAREKPIAGVTSSLIFEKLQNKNSILARKNELPELAAGIDRGVVLMMGAGDIDTLVAPVKKILMFNDHV